MHLRMPDRRCTGGTVERQNGYGWHHVFEWTQPVKEVGHHPLQGFSSSGVPSVPMLAPSQLLSIQLSNFEGLVLGCVEANFACKYTLERSRRDL